MAYKCLSLILALLVFSAAALPVSAEIPDDMPFEVNCRSAVLMEAETGRVLFAKNADLALPPASVTKIMTLLLFMEEVDGGNIALDEEISVSEYAASMGGSQVYLEPGETMTAEELLKCVIIASANDAAVTLAEKVAGSEEAFVNKMNARAEELGMKNTHFENVTGLDDTVTKHLTSAYDIALMSKALLTHETIIRYSTVWMDSIRNGAFGLTNTNRLVRFYEGITGLKTGSTSKAGFCMSATARRDGMHLIAVVMGSPSRDDRNGTARQLLDYGFANYSLFRSEGGRGEPVPVRGGVKDFCVPEIPPCALLLPKGKSRSVQTELLLDEYLDAPVEKGRTIGTVRYLADGEILAEAPVTAREDVERIGFGGILVRIAGRALLKAEE
ncbi:MAG: D-alanyl-D-alanine carboxypeptidase [Clostridia bacterium]|nr:D-alanyl-D-alanine carboxypeptidase [Clostridia bacterium]